VDCWSPAVLAARIQHTLIRPGATLDDLRRHCAECVEYGFDAAMVGGSWVSLATDVLAGTPVKVASAVDFPGGSMSTAGKVAEARALVAAGATELDVMPAIGRLLSGDEAGFLDDLRAVVEAAAPASVKVMLELPLLTPDQRDRAVDLAVEAGVGWVKNASSSAVGVATPADVRYLRLRVPERVRVKASGGIKTRAHAIALLEAGAALVGSSAGIAIVHGTDGVSSY
jgi:deoxyribose-phosphate aldolase